ncbi:NAD(P)H-quinone oxidoreductase subunit 5 [Christiangramia gaetbulicola]|uniref:NAD(P)H-quinone oxidoreductase subunit 5 n=1 Tax=Christiangramia gaetbulicola TaxID=703340 RepID=A0A2T6AIZ0_9FLAO|nr:proton-conducting transporter membrane subunit [Christiangramia gaetbulicola]PTX43726.1 NAD(P)H-quinone oxidoreductase subunit 5 [Christiangramia gaetbulicola]
MISTNKYDPAENKDLIFHGKKSAGPGETGLNDYSRIFTVFLWMLFAGNLLYLIFNYNDLPSWTNGIFRINGFTILIWLTVSFFSAVVSTYSGNYLKGFAYHQRFNWLSLGFTCSVMLLVASEHILLLILSWWSMGLFMSRLIGVNLKWGEARQASNYTQRFFSAGSVFLSLGILLLAFQSEIFTLSELAKEVGSMPGYIVLLSGLCIITAAVIQSAIYPFHRWLLSAMTAPTPASALMHAGFVNGSGILLALFVSLIFASNTLNILFIIGGLTAIIAQFTKLIQVNVKQKLACSTIAQMGFMLMQCGLGFFNAAVAHLILHGFYKAYLFLSAGEEVRYSQPSDQPKIRIKPLQTLVVLLYSVAGAILFALITGKGTKLDSGIFLTLIVAITVGQATYNIVKERSLSNIQKIVAPPVIFACGIGMYGLMYNGVSHIMSDMPLVNAATPLSGIQVAFGIIFLVGFFMMKLGAYLKISWLYVKLLNASQAYKKSVLMYKSRTL